MVWSQRRPDIRSTSREYASVKIAGRQCRVVLAIGRALLTAIFGEPMVRQPTTTLLEINVIAASLVPA
jgi:hypothetical protein